MKHPIKGFSLVLLLSIFLYSCTEDYFEVDKIDTDDWRPELAVPIVNSTLDLEDILIRSDSDGIIQTNPDNNVLEIVYEGSVFANLGGQFINLPQQNFNESISGILIPSSSPDITVDSVFTLSYASTIEVDSILLKDGEIALTTSSTFQHDIDVSFEFPGMFDTNGQALRIDQNLPASNGSQPTVRSTFRILDDRLIDMTDGGSSINKIPVEVSMTIKPIAGNPTSLSDELRFQGIIRDLDFKEFSGYFGQRSLELKLDTVNINLFKNFKVGTFFISNPTLEIDIFNSFAVPTNLEFLQLKARNPDYTQGPTTQSVNLPPEPITNDPNVRRLKSPDRYGQEVTSIDLDKNNSNIPQIISFLLEEIIYESTASFNPEGKAGPRNFITDNSGIGLDVFLRIPFEGRVRQFILVDTIDFEFEVAEDIEKGTVRVIADNSFPVDVKLQVLFQDENYNTIDSLYEQGAQSAIPGADIDANGDAIGSKRLITDAVVDRSRLDQLARSKFAIIQAELNTSGAIQNRNVRFTADHRLSVAIGLKAGILIN